MDVWVRPDGADAKRVYAALVAFGAPLGELGVKVDDFATADVVTQFGMPPRRIGQQDAFQFSQVRLAHDELML